MYEIIIYIRCSLDFVNFIFTHMAGVLTLWLKLPAWEVGNRGFELRSGIQVLKKQNVPSLLNRKD